MIRILISGKDSYIGNHIADWLLKAENNHFKVDFLDVRQGDWVEKDFRGYNAIVHVAGIVHRKDITNSAIYDKVNTQLPYEVAKKAKAEGVEQFIFLSTMAVYGIGKRLKENIVDQNTPINPKSLYGQSKYNAEKKLKSLADDSFILSIVRPPNVYGKGCKGGYISSYASIVKKLPVIPNAFGNVKQSVLYIDNLCEFIKLLIINKDAGTFLPQDDKAVSAVELMDAIGVAIGRKKKKLVLLGKIVSLFSFAPIVIKGYGGVAYPLVASHYKKGNYVKVTFDEAIKYTLS